MTRRDVVVTRTTKKERALKSRSEISCEIGAPVSGQSSLFSRQLRRMIH